VTLTRAYPADSLVSFAPGMYGINVQITTSVYLTAIWAGAIRLPITQTP
jgi:hypothetical protein